MTEEKRLYFYRVKRYYAKTHVFGETEPDRLRTGWIVNGFGESPQEAKDILDEWLVDSYGNRWREFIPKIQLCSFPIIEEDSWINLSEPSP